MRYVILLFVIAGLVPVPAEAQISLGAFAFSQANANRQHEGCYDWYKETCESRMTQAIPNGLGLNNLVFCWDSICRVPGTTCLGCDGICSAAGLRIPERLGGNPDLLYFYAFYADEVWHVMTSI